MSTVAHAQQTGIAGPKTGIRGWIVLTALFAFYLINYADKAVLGLAAGPIMKELHISATEYGLVSSAFFFVFSFSALLVGFLVDRFRTKPILMVMALVWTVAQALLLAPGAGLLTLVAGRMVLGLGEGPAFGVTNHAALKWFPANRRSLAVTGVGLGTPLGTVIAIPLLAWALSGMSWQATFGALAFVSLVWAIVWAIVGKEGPFVEAATKETNAGKRNVAAYLKVLATPSFIGVLVAGIASYWATVLLLTWVPTFLSAAQGYAPAETAGFTMAAWFVQALSIFFVVGVLSTFMVKRKIDTRWSRGFLGGVVVLLSGLAMLGFYFAPKGALSIVLMALAFGLSAGVVPMSQAVISEIAPTHIRGGVLGVYTAVFSLTGIVAPALTGFFVDQAGSKEAGFGAAFMITAVLLIVAGILCALMTNPKRDAARLGLGAEAAV